MINTKDNVFILLAEKFLSEGNTLDADDWDTINRRNRLGMAVLIFSACAVEQHTNEILSQPLLVAEPRDSRKNLSRTIMGYLKTTSIRKKLKDVDAVVPIERAVLKNLNSLFDERNSIVHAKPLYMEMTVNKPRVTFSSLYFQGDEFIGEEVKSLLSKKEAPIEAFADAERYFEVAKKYMKTVTAEDYRSRYIGEKNPEDVEQKNGGTA